MGTGQTRRSQCRGGTLAHTNRCTGEFDRPYIYLSPSLTAEGAVEDGRRKRSMQCVPCFRKQSPGTLLCPWGLLVLRLRGWVFHPGCYQSDSDRQSNHPAELHEFPVKPEVGGECVSLPLTPSQFIDESTTIDTHGWTLDHTNSRVVLVLYITMWPLAARTMNMDDGYGYRSCRPGQF